MQSEEYKREKNRFEEYKKKTEKD